jgi:hypothetical protein
MSKRAVLFCRTEVGSSEQTVDIDDTYTVDAFEISVTMTNPVANTTKAQTFSRADWSIDIYTLPGLALEFSSEI